MAGVRQWLRQCSLVVATADGEHGIELSELRVRFSIEARTTLIQPDKLEARVYNLSEETVQKLFALPIVPPGVPVTGNARVPESVPASSATGLGKPATPQSSPPGQVRLQAGYAGNFGTIFQGQLVQIRRGRESPTDDFVDIYAADGDATHKWGMMNTTLAAGWTPQDVVTRAVQACAPLGLTGGKFPAETDPPARPAPRGKVCFGMVREVLEDIATTHRVNFWINRNNLEIVPITAYKPGEAVVITSATGMIGYPQQTNFGLSVRCLLNPAIGRGSVVKIDNKSVQRLPFSPTIQSDAATINRILSSNLNADGFYKAIMVSHTGDTRGNEWYTMVEAISIDPTSPGRQAVPDPSLLSLYP